MDLEKKLQDVFNNNLIAYYIFHSCHINVVGRNFVSDHKLLGKLYEDSQAQTDLLGEFIRTLGAFVPSTLSAVINNADIDEIDTANYSADEMLETVLEITESLLHDYEELFDLATIENKQDIANYSADRIAAHSKFIWQLRSTLD